jgi:hypothetical protein
MLPTRWSYNGITPASQAGDAGSTPVHRFSHNLLWGKQIRIPLPDIPARAVNHLLTNLRIKTQIVSANLSPAYVEEIVAGLKKPRRIPSSVDSAMCNQSTSIPMSFGSLPGRVTVPRSATVSVASIDSVFVYFGAPPRIDERRGSFYANLMDWCIINWNFDKESWRPG